MRGKDLLEKMELADEKYIQAANLPVKKKKTRKFFKAAAIILAVGGIPAIVKIVQGQADENSRDRNAGIATLLIAAAGFGATFAIDSAIGI